MPIGNTEACRNYKKVTTKTWTTSFIGPVHRWLHILLTRVAPPLWLGKHPTTRFLPAFPTRSAHQIRRPSTRLHRPTSPRSIRHMPPNVRLVTLVHTSASPAIKTTSRFSDVTLTNTAHEPEKDKEEAQQNSVHALRFGQLQEKRDLEPQSSISRVVLYRNRPHKGFSGNAQGVRRLQ